MAMRTNLDRSLPGDPNASELIRRIESTDKDLRMPPPDFGKDVSEQERSVAASVDRTRCKMGGALGLSTDS